MKNSLVKAEINENKIIVLKVPLSYLALVSMETTTSNTKAHF